VEDIKTTPPAPPPPLACNPPLPPPAITKISALKVNPVTKRFPVFKNV
jgi:hypothetical protein